MIEETRHGLGKHVWAIPLEDLSPFLRAAWFSVLWYMMTLWATKLSILLLYLRILTYRWAKLATYVLIAITMATNVWTLVSVVTACIPLRAFWDHTVNGFCRSQNWWFANTGMHMLTDFLIYLLPTPVIFALRLGLRQKMLLYFVFAFGFFLCLISIFRLVYLLQDSAQPDFGYYYVTIAYWTSVEVNLAIICACVMTMKPLATRLFPRLFTDRPISGDPERLASHSIGGRPLAMESRTSKMAPADHSSWVAVHERTGSEMSIIEEENDGATLSSTELQAEQSIRPSAPGRAHVRDRELDIGSSDETLHGVEL